MVPIGRAAANGSYRAIAWLRGKQVNAGTGGTGATVVVVVMLVVVAVAVVPPCLTTKLCRAPAPTRRYHLWNLAHSLALSAHNASTRLFTLNRAYTPGLGRFGVGIWTGDISVSWQAFQQTPATVLYGPL